MKLSKGFIMITLIVLIIVLMIIGFGLSVYIIHLTRENELEVRSIRGYYLMLGALRYADILSQSPATYGISSTPGTTYTVTGIELGGSLATDLSAAGVIVTQNNTQDVNSLYTTIAPSTSVPGKFDAASKYRYY